jgi:hypothetical protein
VQRFVSWKASTGLLIRSVLRQDEKRGLKGDEVLRGGRGHAAFELKRQQFALDDAGIGPLGSLRQAAGRDVTQEALIEQRMVCRGDEVEVIESDADELDTVDEAQAGGGNAGLRRGAGHDGPDDIVGEHEGIEFLDHADRFLAAQRVLRQALVGVDLVDGEFDLPAVVVGTDQVAGGSLLGVAQGGDQAMCLAEAGTRPCILSEARATSGMPIPVAMPR